MIRLNHDLFMMISPSKSCEATLSFFTEMQKVADAADISVLFFSVGANFWAIFGQFWVIFGLFWVILGHFWAIFWC